MDIVKYPDARLREISEEVKLPLSNEDRKLLDEMYSWLKEHEDTAVGLSAIQIGVAKRMCVIRTKIGNIWNNYKLVNPKIVRHGFPRVAAPEGCLSVPEEHTEGIPRWQEVMVTAFDAIQNKNIIINASGWLARVLQHEIDHMDGKLYIDYIKEVAE